MVHPHDTDRILAVLGEAISKLRDESARSHWEGHPLADMALDTANDLALLHGAVSAEAQQAKDRSESYWRARHAQEAAFERVTRGSPWRQPHREEIQAEVERGEHDDHDWSPDGD